MATMSDIAAAAEVSVTTVSRVLSGRGDIPTATRLRVTEAANRLGYRRSDTDRGRPNRSHPRTIELVLGVFDDGWTNEVTAGARAGAASLGYDLVLTQERDDPKDDWPRRVAARRSSGVVLGLIKPSMSQLDTLRGLNIPLVLLDPSSDPAGRFESIGTTDRQGGWDVGAHLAALGHRHFIVVAGEPHFRFGRAREEGFLSAIKELAPDGEIVTVKGTWQEDDLTQTLEPVFASFPATAIFACNDAMAAGVYKAAAQLGLRIPRDLSVVGFDDTPRYSGLSPALTTIHQPIRAMATRAVELVQQLRNGTLVQLERIEVPTTLVVRGSTRPPRPKDH